MTDKREVTDLVDMESLVAQQGGEPVRLFQTTGQGANRAFRVLPLQRALIGRAESSAIFIDETGVSRQHALIEHHEGAPRVIDLGSTNGTFVNGERIDTSPLHTGDLVRVGSAVFEVTVGTSGEAEARPKEQTDPKMRRQIAQIHQQLQGSSTVSGPLVIQKTLLAGRIENLDLPSLLQVLETNRNTGTLVISLDDRVGQLYLKKGKLLHAALGRCRGKKALYRMLPLTQGHFELVAPGFEPEEPSIESPLEALMLEGMTEFDEFSQYRASLPPDQAELAFVANRTFVVARMTADLLEALAAIARYRTVGAVIDGCDLSDLNVCRHLLMLLNERVVQVVGDGD